MQDQFGPVELDAVSLLLQSNTVLPHESASLPVTSLVLLEVATGDGQSVFVQENEKCRTFQHEEVTLSKSERVFSPHIEKKKNPSNPGVTSCEDELTL